MKSFYDLVLAFMYPDDDILPHYSSLRAFQYDLRNYRRIHRADHPLKEKMLDVVNRLYSRELGARSSSKMHLRTIAVTVGR